MAGDARNYSWPPFEANNRAALKHGATARDVPEVALAIVSDLVGRDVYERHPETSLRAAETWTRIRRAESWLAEHGDLDADGKPRPVLGQLATWDALLIRLSAMLGLDPLSKARLDVLRGDVRHGRPVELEDPKVRALEILDELVERREKKAEWERSHRKPAGALRSPPRPALGAGVREVVTDVQVVVDDIEEDSVHAKALRLLDQLAARRDQEGTDDE